MCRSRSNLVIINSEQFGYHIDTYYYCKYLKDRYNIIYIGWDHGLEQVELPGIQTEYIDRSGRPFRIIRLLIKIFQLTRSPDAIIFISFFKGISIAVRLMCFRHPIVLDIRTGSIEPSRIKRYYQDCLLKFGCIFFRNITIISDGLAHRIGISKRATILPLGADVISDTDKVFSSINLLYVGTLYNRRLNIAIDGFRKFFLEKEKNLPIRFTLVGAGPGNEIEQLKEQVEKSGLNDIVHFTGRVMHNQLQEYFDTHNIGVSYIPMTGYYDAQPATKTYEYLLSGLAVIGTATSENMRVIKDSNGVLTDDSSEGFYKGLVKISARLNMFDSARIRRDARQFNWKNITDDLDFYLLSVRIGTKE